MSKMKKQTKILISLFIIAFIIRSIFLLSSTLRIWDETVYANLGYDLSHAPLKYSLRNAGWGDYIRPQGDQLYCWPRIGFRAPLLPYSLALLYFLNLGFLINFFTIFIGTMSVCLIYILGKEIFNEKIALYSSILFLIIPTHVTHSAMILTGILLTFFTLLTFISFWKGFEKNDKKHKILFGIFLALALLSRYTALWIMPIFLVYFLARNKSLKFIKDRYLWYSILAFFITLTPWFIYGISEYKNPIGAFIHGSKGATYSGGTQPWYFLFNYWLQMFSIIGVIFIIALIYIAYKREFLKKEIYLLLFWFIIFLSFVIYMPHKEARFMLPIVPAICLISGYFINKIKKYQKLVLIATIIICLISLTIIFRTTYKNSHTDTNECFLKANQFLKNKENAMVITDESTIVYYYTKKIAMFYPNPWSYNVLKDRINNYYPDKNIFILFTDFDMPLNDEEHINIKEDLDKNLEKVFECKQNQGFSIVYQFK